MLFKRLSDTKRRGKIPYGQSTSKIENLPTHCQVSRFMAICLCFFLCQDLFLAQD